jgi:hypothetical protein
MKNVYFITIHPNIKETKERIGQKEFREGLIEKYSECILSGDNMIECDACHIIPHSEGENYDINNGLLLNKQLHDLYDKYYWTINPYTKKVEVSEDAINKKLTCCKYNNNDVKIEMNPVLLFNLIKKYNIYLNENK